MFNNPNVTVFLVPGNEKLLFFCRMFFFVFLHISKFWFVYFMWSNFSPETVSAL